MVAMAQSPVKTMPGQTATDENHPASFYIAASANIQESWPRVLKHGNTFAMFDQHGDILHAAGNPAGIFHEDTRYLSGCYLLIEGHRPLLLSSTIRDDNGAFTVDLANPDIYRDGELALSREILHVTRTKFLWNSTCYERLAMQNFDSREHTTRVLLWFAADFADLFEVRGLHRARRGTCRCEKLGADGIQFHYRGLDDIDRYTHIRFAPAPAVLDQHHAAFDVTLKAGERASAFVTMSFGTSPRIGGQKFVHAVRAARKNLRCRARRMAAISTSNQLLNQALCQAVADLNMLTTETPQGPYPYAGTPWFSTAFGRDGIITALQMLWLDPSVALGVLKFLAAHQAKDFDEKSEAEPGKILHEIRHGEMANLGEVPFKHYYGSVDSTPLFVLLAGRYFERSNDLDAMAALWPNIEVALGWIDKCGDFDGDGFVEYRQKTPQGLNNQGWKDSKDCISHSDGSLAEGAIALVEVQAYVFAAKRAAATIARALGDVARAEELEREADHLRTRFERTFWCDDIGTYALALDGDKQPCAVRSSNPGHALFAGIASEANAARVAACLLRRDSFSGWGIRTLNCCEKRFNPMSYHNGSVWPHDNSLIALGFARYGFKDEVLKVLNGFYDSLHYLNQLRLPELFCGFGRREGSGPTLYPVACSPQAWASGTLLALLEACLGMRIDGARNEVRLERPLLPPFIDDIRISNLQVGDGCIDLLLQRHGRDVVVDILKRTADIRVVTVS
ncbi:MAG TPA: amylo-alpha-1,6-glucosidase [Rhizomicrobium sp.]|jgi:glycogen debranching enzyme